MTLSRDASVLGDRVSAENYLQHAEHYLRIVAAGQAQNEEQATARTAQQSAANGSQQPEMRNGDGGERDGGSSRPPRRGKYDKPARASSPDRSSSNDSEETADKAEPEAIASDSDKPAKSAAISDDTPEVATVGETQDG